MTKPELIKHLHWIIDRVERTPASQVDQLARGMVNTLATHLNEPVEIGKVLDNARFAEVATNSSEFPNRSQTDAVTSADANESPLEDF